MVRGGGGGGGEGFLFPSVLEIVRKARKLTAYKSI